MYWIDSFVAMVSQTGVLLDLNTLNLSSPSLLSLLRYTTMIKDFLCLKTVFKRNSSSIISQLRHLKPFRIFSIIKMELLTHLQNIGEWWQIISKDMKMWLAMRLSMSQSKDLYTIVLESFYFQIMETIIIFFHYTEKWMIRFVNTTLRNWYSSNQEQLISLELDSRILQEV
jgi:hypothetical protein